MLEDAGFEVVRKFVALRYINNEVTRIESQKSLAKLDKVAERMFKRFPDLRVEHGSKENIEEVLRQVNLLGNEVRSEGWGFVPLTPAELEFMVSQVKRIINLKTVILMYVGGELAGYHISIPDINWAVGKTKGPDWLRYLQLPFWLKRIPRTRCIAAGAAKKHRRTGIGVLIGRDMTALMDMYDVWSFHGSMKKTCCPCER